MPNQRPDIRVGPVLLDLLGYVVVVDILVFGVAVAGKTLVGGQWVVVEEIMFVVGVLLFGYATLLLWPTSIEDEEDTRMDDYTATGRIQSLVDAAPVSTADGESSRRLPESGKLFLASIVVVLTAFLVERVFVV